MKVIEMPFTSGEVRAAVADLMICLRRLGTALDAPTRDTGEETWTGPAADACADALHRCGLDVLAASLAISAEIGALNEWADVLDAIAPLAPR